MQNVVSVECRRGFRTRCSPRRLVAIIVPTGTSACLRGEKKMSKTPRTQVYIALCNATARYTYGGNFRFACAGSLRNIKLRAEQGRKRWSGTLSKEGERRNARWGEGEKKNKVITIRKISSAYKNLFNLLFSLRRAPLVANLVSPADCFSPPSDRNNLYERGPSHTHRSRRKHDECRVCSCVRVWA